jgi:hypothetical protein
MIKQARNRRNGLENGVSLVFVGLGLVLLMAIAGIGIDLATLYVARNEAQRAADNAALAGAKMFVSTNVANGLMTPAQAEPLAAAQAAQVGNENKVIGRDPGLEAMNFNSTCPPPTSISGGCFDFSATNDPRITVVVHQNMPTYFMRVFGITSVPVSAKATAEAYTPIGDTGPVNTVTCPKPWLLPNCDPGQPVTGDSSEANTTCGALPFTGPGGETLYPSYYVDPTSGQVVHPGLTPTGSVGEKLRLRSSKPGDSPAPSQFWSVFLADQSASPAAWACPTCASADQQNSTSNSGALYRESIECCGNAVVTCGLNTVDPISGDMSGPTVQGVDCLIHEQNNGSGQDCISLDSSPVCPNVVPTLQPPFQIYSGTNNPYPAQNPPGSKISTSDSLITVPIYAGDALCPGNSCPTSVSVNVQGFLQLFLRNEGTPANSVYAYVLGITSCGGSAQTGGGGEQPIPTVAGSPIPVRLVHE